MHESSVAAERHQPSGLTDPGSTAPRIAGRRRFLQGLVITIPIVAFAALCWQSRFLYDDGYIYLHVVQQILHGNGPVYNVGQRVETYTGPLWVAILVPTTLLSPLSSETSALVVGILFFITQLVEFLYNPFVFAGMLNMLFSVFLVALLLHPMSRSYQRIYFH